MLGQPVLMLIPQVVGVKLTGSLPEGATATDLVLTVTEMLRKRGVVGKFVEYYGEGLAAAAPGRPRDDREHGARVRRDVRHLPGRRRDTAVPALHRARRGAGEARRGVLQGAGALPRRRGSGGALHGGAAPRSRVNRAEPRRARRARRIASSSPSRRQRSARPSRRCSRRPEAELPDAKAARGHRRQGSGARRTAPWSSRRSRAARTRRTRACSWRPGSWRRRRSRRD